MSKRKRIIKYSIFIFAIFVVGSIIFSAYIYKPKEYTEFQSEYLAINSTQYTQLENYNAHFFKKGAGDTVILVHGGGSWLYSYKNNINPLSEYFEVHALDMPGHGYTIAVSEPIYNLDTYADFIYMFMEMQQIEKASFVGHSWGGGWATYFAMKYPDKVDKLILIASSGLNLPDKSEWRYLNYPVLGEIIANFISLNATKNSLEDMVCDSDFVTDLYAKEIFAPISKPNNRRAQYLSQRNMNWKITDERMRELNHRTLLIFGDNDPYFEIEYANQFNDRLESSTLVTIKNFGHLPHEENYEEVNKMMIEFLLNH